jgi:hypothetical protein
MKITKKYKIRKPIELNWPEADGILTQLSRDLIGVYNKAALDIYSRLLNPRPNHKDQSKTEGIHIEQWSTDMIYHPAYEVCKSSILALGIKSKLTASFGGGKAKDMRKGLMSPPFVNRNRFPLTFYKQAKFEFTRDEKGVNIIIPLPTHIKKDKIDKYKPWQKYDLTGGQTAYHFQLVIPPQDDFAEKLINKEYKCSTIELSEKRGKWYLSLVTDIPVVKQALDKKKIASISFRYDRPITVSIPGKELKIKKNTLEHITSVQLSRIRAISEQSGLDRTGRGKKYKFKNLTKISEKYRERRKKLIEKWISLVDRFLIANNIGRVIINPINQEDKQKSLLLRLKWPVAEIQNRLINRLTQTGIDIELAH